MALTPAERTKGEMNAGRARTQFYEWQEATKAMKHEIVANIKLDKTHHEQYTLLVAELHRALSEVRVMAIAMAGPGVKPPTFFIQTAIGSFDETKEPA